MRKYTGCHSYQAALFIFGLLFMFMASCLVVDASSSIRLEVNGEKIYDGDFGFFEKDKLPTGFEFNPDTRTITLNNANIQVPAATKFINSYGNEEQELHIVLKGNSTITSLDSFNDLDNCINEELIHSGSKTILEGNGSLTVKNNIGNLFNVHNGTRFDLTIKDCTLNCTQKGWEIFCVNNLTLDKCVLNTEYNTSNAEACDGYAGSSSLVYVEGRLVMNQAVWNVKTSGQGNDTLNNANVSINTDGEFHNSKFVVTGDYFNTIGFGIGEVIFDKATFLGKGRVSGTNYDPYNEGRLTYYNFVNKHQSKEIGSDWTEIYSGKYGADKIYMLSFEITPYTGSGQGGTSSGGSSSAAKKVTSLSIVAPSNKIAAGKKVSLKVNVLPADASNKGVTWSSGDTKIATVSSSGVVTLLKNTGGKKVTITAKAKDGSGKTASIVITSMKGQVKKIKITGKKSVNAGKSVKLKAVVTAAKGANKAIAWTSANTKYATVSKSGKVKALKAGKGKTVKITAAALDGTGKKTSFKLKIK